jgi:hypothetical protein
MGLVRTGRGQAFRGDFGVQTYPINVVIIIGGEHGILAGTDGMMGRIVPAAATQANKGAVAFTAALMVRAGAAQRPSNAARQRHEQAAKNDIHQHFGDGLHGQTVMCQGKGPPIAPRGENVNREIRSYRLFPLSLTAPP